MRCLVFAMTLLLWLNTGLQAAVDTFILLPDQEGKTGAIIVTSPKGSKLLKKSYSMLKVDALGNFTVIKSNDLCVDKAFDDSLTSMPKPRLFLLHFKDTSGNMDADSVEVMDALIEQIKATPAPFVIIRGDAALAASIKAMLQKHAVPGMNVLLDTLIDIASGASTDVVKVSVQ